MLRRKTISRLLEETGCDGLNIRGPSLVEILTPEATGWAGAGPGWGSGQLLGTSVTGGVRCKRGVGSLPWCGLPLETSLAPGVGLFSPVHKQGS